MTLPRRLVVVSGCLLFAGAAWAYWFLVRHSFSARTAPTAIEAVVARNLRRLATQPGVRSLKQPLSPTPLNIAEARDHFADHCAICHANDGSGRTMIGSNMYPPAPDMRSNPTQALTDGELMYIIKNGIRFTGMPGWDGKDEENWKLVLFIRHIPKLGPEEIKIMKELNRLDESAGSPSQTESGPRHEKH